MTLNQKTTIRVRIAVAISPNGEWHATGGSDFKGDAATEWLHMSPGTLWSLHWIEADVPLPVAETIEGRVATDAERVAEAVSREGLR